LSQSKRESLTESAQEDMMVFGRLISPRALISY
jgi:hypothetical protein